MKIKMRLHWLSGRHPLAVACRIGLYLTVPVIILLAHHAYQIDDRTFDKIEIGMSRPGVFFQMGWPAGDRTFGRFEPSLLPPDHWDDCTYWISESGMYIVWFDSETGKVINKLRRPVFKVQREPIWESIFRPSEKIRE